MTTQEKQSKKAEELDYGDHIAGYSRPLKEVILTKTAVQCVTELGDVVKFRRGDTVELATPWPQGMQIVYLYDWQCGVIGSDYNRDTAFYGTYTTLYGYRFSPGDNLGKCGAATIVPARELNELDAAYQADSYEKIITAVKNFLSAIGRLG